ncbi:hypothetical protein BD779DRAFT_1611269 [Infundibulicybe gibba]|nr:hypothetical protein BD779DRAFT_1611269 [Infundibulicybe gibba]
MYFTTQLPITFLTALALSLPTVISACEGDCIVDITNAWIGNYTTPISICVGEITKKMAHTADMPPGSMDLIVNTFKKTAYDPMKTAIFPSYFHGKCQQNGVEPSGCPNPDCPVVCGTPGSMVHFYKKLLEIVYDEVRRQLKLIISQDSEVYKKLLAEFLAAVDKRNGDQAQPRRVFRFSRFGSAHARGEDMKEIFNKHISSLPSEIEKFCDPELEHCSWEMPMKKFILSFP